MTTFTKSAKIVFVNWTRRIGSAKENARARAGKISMRKIVRNAEEPIDSPSFASDPEVLLGEFVDVGRKRNVGIENRCAFYHTVDPRVPLDSTCDVAPV